MPTLQERPLGAATRCGLARGGFNQLLKGRYALAIFYGLPAAIAAGLQMVLLRRTILITVAH